MAVNGANPLLHPDFVASLLTHFGTKDVRLAVLGDPVQPAAMAMVQRVNGISWRTFQPSQAPIGLWLATTEASIADLVAQLFHTRP